jgi:sugar lactone lactonase YvrE
VKHFTPSPDVLAPGRRPALPGSNTRVPLRFLLLAAFFQTIGFGLAPSSVSVSATPNPSIYGQAVTLTATVTAGASGMVTFYDGVAMLGVANISGGQATWTTRLLPAGVRSLHAYYGGDGTYAPSMSANISQTVNAVAAGGFQPAVTYPANLMPNSPTVGDFNSDGNADLAVANYTSGVSILLGNGDGTFQPAVSYAAGGTVNSVAVGDFNSDGIADLALTNPDSSTVSILLGVGDGTFQAPHSFPCGRNPASITVADLKGDGIADLIVVARSDGTISVLLGNGNGTFRAPVNYAVGGVGSQPQVLAAADLNGDGKTDLLVTIFLPGEICVLLGNGDGTLQAPVTYFPGGTPCSVAVGDFNGDSKLDLAVGLGPGGLSVFIGNGDGTFQSASTSGTEDYLGNLIVGDFDGDGKLDIAISENGANAAVTVLLGKGDGTFQPPVLYRVGITPTHAVTVGDFNGDGRSDLAVTTIQDGTVSILLGRAAANPKVSAVAVIPASGSAASQLFTFQFSDTAGNADLETVSGLIGFPGWPVVNECMVTYDGQLNTLVLSNDDGTIPGTTITPGSGFQHNSWCTLDGSQSFVIRTGNQLQLNVAIGFASSFSGIKSTWGNAVSKQGTMSGWQQLGTWTVPSPIFFPQPRSVSPSSGIGLAGTFVFAFDSNGPTDIHSVQATIGTAETGASSCTIMVQPNSSLVWLANDAGNGWIGSDVLGTPGSLQNSQCAVNVPSSSGVWSGNTYVLTLPVTFARTYVGAKNIYGEETSLSLLGFPLWGLLGTWTVGTTPAPGPYLFSTLAGVSLPATSIPAKSAQFPQPNAVATDRSGNVYFSDSQLHAVFRLDTSGALTRIAGTGSFGYSGDNGPAVNAQLLNPDAVAADLAGNIFIADSFVVRKVSPAGIITTVAGGGCCNSPGDNGPATSAELRLPRAVAVDTSGNLFIAEEGANRIRKVDTSGTITTVAGNGTAGYAGDGGAAASAQLFAPSGVAADASGNLFIADTDNHRIREVSPDGIITTLAGNGVAGDSGDGGPAASAQVYFPQGIAVDALGNCYIQEPFRVRMIAANGIISTVAGGDAFGFGGDGGPAVGALFGEAFGVAVDLSGTIYVADTGNQRIRRVSGGIIDTVAGGGTVDGDPASLAVLLHPQSVAKDKAGNVYVADDYASRVYKITPVGVISTVAGTGVPGFSGDGGPASAAQLSSPTALAEDSNGSLYILDQGNRRIRMVSNTGTIITVAGNGNFESSGDGGLGVNAGFFPTGLAVDSLGSVYVADNIANRVRKVAPDGLISTVAGNGTSGHSGDFGLATDAQLWDPTGLAVDSMGNLYIADTGNERIRMVTPNHIITTFAGSTWGDSGEGVVATTAQLNNPTIVAADFSGNVFIVAGRLRVVTPDGVIYSVSDYYGSGYSPNGLTVDAAGIIYATDYWNRLVRVLIPVGTRPVLTVTSTHTGTFQPGSAAQYTVTVSDAAQSGPTSDVVTVTELIPDGLTLLSMSGTGWLCNGNTCTCSNTLNGGSSYPPITVAVNVSTTAPPQFTNQVTVSGGGAAMAGAQDLTLLAQVQVTVTTNPAGQSVTVDGAAYPTPSSFYWTAGSNHTINVTSAQAGAGVRYTFAGWSDGGAQSHIVTPTVGTTYTANFTTQYLLTTAIVPAAAGALAANPASADGYYNSGTSVQLTATPSAGYGFSNFTGDLTGAGNPQSVSMTAPRSATANFTAAASAPAAVSVAPNTGSGIQQTFTFHFSDGLGATDLSTMFVYFNSSFSAAVNACLIEYDRPSNTLFLFNDTGTAWIPMTLGAAGTIANSQCSINTGTATANLSGPDLMLTLPVTFAPGYSGAKNSYAYAGGSSANSGWQTLGTWTVPVVVSALSMFPSSGSGLQQTFTFHYSDGVGSTDLSTVFVWFNSAFTSAANSCFIEYNRSANSIYLLNDAGAAWTAAVLGSATTLSNSQCSVNATTAVANLTGNDLALALPVTFAAGYGGTKNAYSYVSGSSANSGWQTLGTWNVTGTVTGVNAVSALPAWGNSLQQTFAFHYSDAAGATDLSTMFVWFNSAFSSAVSSCFVEYDRRSNTIFLLNDAGAAWTSAAVGAAVTLSNSQCSINAATAGVTASGPDLTLNLPVTFVAGYFGSKNIYSYAAGTSLNSGWQTLGTWTVPLLSAVSVTPASGNAASQTFTFHYADGVGAADLSTAFIWFNAAFTSAVNSCFIEFYRPTNTLYLLNDAGSAWTSGIVGSAGVLSNSQCSINTGTATVNLSGNDLTLTLPISFAHAFTGSKSVFSYISGASANSGWQTLGSWIVP